MSDVLYAIEPLTAGALQADWLEAWATVTAAVGTVGAFIWQARSLRHERIARKADVARLESQQLEAQAAQARTVIVHRPEIEQVVGFVTEYRLTVGNYGTAPVLALSADLRSASDKKYFDREAAAPVVLSVGETHQFNWKLEEHRIEWPPGVPKGLVSMFALRAHVLFTDINWVRWLVEPGSGEPVPMTRSYNSVPQRTLRDFEVLEPDYVQYILRRSAPDAET